MGQRQRAVAVAAFALLILLFLAGPAAGDSPGAEFEDTTLDASQNGIQEVTVSLEAGETAKIEVSGIVYQHNLSATDADNDGSVTVAVNLYKLQSGHGNPYTAVGDDSITVNVSERPEGKTAIAQTYRLTLHHAGQPTATAFLSIGETAVSEPVARVIPDEPAQPALTPSRAHNATVTGNVVAQGERAVIEYDVSSIRGRLQTDGFPGNNLIFANSSLPGESGTHTVQVSGTTAGIEFDRIAVDYDATDGNVPSSLANLSIEAVGIDANSDGMIDYSLYRHLATVQTNASGTVQIHLDDQFTIDEDDSLLLRYTDITNPETTGSDAVAVSLSSHTVTGTVEYGISGSGQLGNGVTVKTEIDGNRAMIAPLPYTVIPDLEAGSLFVEVPTAAFSSASEAMTNVTTTVQTGGQRAQTAAYTSDKTLSIVSRPISLDITAQDVSDHSQTLLVEGQTTIPPGKNLTFYAIQRTPGKTSLAVYPVSISEQQTFRFETEPIETKLTDSVVFIPKTNYTAVTQAQIWRPE